MLPPTALSLYGGFAGDAIAYIDPGTGSFLLQLLLGTAVGVLLSIKLFWRRLRMRFASLFGRSGEQQ